MGWKGPPVDCSSTALWKWVPSRVLNMSKGRNFVASLWCLITLEVFKQKIVCEFNSLQHPFIQSMHHEFGYMDIPGCQVKDLAKVKVNIVCSSLVHGARHCVVEGIQVGWLSLAYGSLLLAVPRPSLILYGLGNGLEEDLPRSLSRNWDETAACSFLDSLPSIIEDRCNLFLEIRNLLWSPWPFRNGWVRPCSDTVQLLQHLWLHPIWSQGLVLVLSGISSS